MVQALRPIILYTTMEEVPIINAIYTAWVGGPHSAMTMAAMVCLRRLICLLVVLVTSSGVGGRQKRQGSAVSRAL